MRNKNYDKYTWAIITAAVICGSVSSEYIGEIFFFNSTNSMPTGLYQKISKSEYKLGDIIVFKLEKNKDNLLKFIAGREGDEFCTDFSGTLWVNGFPLAQKNMQKYPTELTNQSMCQTLKRGELLVLGEHPNSYDSRYFGFIKADQVVAQVKLIIGIERPKE